MPSLTLTAEQRAIVDAPVGHYVIRAVAGSGKTTTLAYRIQHLLQQGLEPRRVLVLMFNKSAQLDFQSKLQKLVGGSSAVPEVRTFHAMGFRLYQRFISIGALPAYQGSILSEREQQFHLLQLVPQVLSPEQHTEFKRYKKEYLDVAARFIDQCKSQLDDPASFFRSSNLDKKFSFLPILFERFEEWRHDHRRISYADMLYDPVRALLADPELRQQVENKMDVILVDEYQDTNDIQHALLTLIAGRRAQVTIVGDPDQTIYEFRGAKPQYMLTGFAQEFQDTEALNLSTSFRYGHQVALLANQLISHSPYHEDALCIPSETNPDTQVEICESNDELNSLTKRLAKHSEQALQNTAILVRYWSQAAPIELALLRANVPYTLQGHRGIFGSDEMSCLRTVLQLASGDFKLLTEEQRLASLMQLGRFPHLGINERQMHDVMQSLAHCNSRWGNHLLSLIPEQLSRYQKLKLERFAKALSAVENNANAPRKVFAHYVSETKLYEELKSSGLSEDASNEQIRTIKGLVEFMSQDKAESASALLQNLAELEARTQSRNQNIASAGLQLTSIHRAKGLEWDNVILPGLSETNFFAQQGKNDVDIASERRLIYVAMTRARERLLMFCPPESSKDRLRFLDEMAANASLDMAKAIKQGQSNINLNDAPSAISQRYAAHFELDLNWDKNRSQVRTSQTAHWTANNVVHKLLGKGRVVKEEGDTFTVEFDDHQRRVFSKRYADQVFEPA
ncbi:hypothetical protein A3765_10120 [Oleiphilus sp. HI0130]|nr:hypothetical protein A3765_10120 [Oleiphilus sp. HI0130]KZZ76641.1 hypothetical protein A3767_02965 [Oleiphilus sp. HI0133]